MNIKLLVDSKDFWSSLQKDIRASSKCIYIQTLSFEGDRVGKMLSSELLSSRLDDIRILVDSYTKFVINDRFLYTLKNCFDSGLRAESAQTAKMIDELNGSGICVKFTNPVGFLLSKFPARNHKKMILIDDDIAYIGGINFSEHNFEWHDLMIRIVDRDIVCFLKKDFLSTWQELHIYSEGRFENISLYLYDGSSNEKSFQRIFDLIENAQKSILIQSPYMSFPFYEKLRAAKNRGVGVTITAPEKNNRKLMGKYILWESARSGIELRLYKSRMTHAKYMLIDDEILVFGSTNFDYVSYRVEQELIAIIRDSDLISDFRCKVIEPDLDNSTPFNGKVNYHNGFWLYIGLKITGIVTTSLAKI